ncbi:uncharacterized protein B0T23DRAFT_383371 [Neurospora hispaniola]|uniref:Uncharacterized protein n=1 Tax=Neurospora hispaniola TaxID=588809 RepID=A0AAJ0I6M6_9PEZI|nr:hypothetical protein B0T23DRAFT_383371 [Neurospora hispaniola]
MARLLLHYVTGSLPLAIFSSSCWKKDMEAKSYRNIIESNGSCWRSTSTNRLVTLRASHRFLNTTQHSCYIREPLFHETTLNPGTSNI